LFARVYAWTQKMALCRFSRNVRMTMKLKPEDLSRQGGIASAQSNRPDDLFIVCASYEPRTTFVADSLARDYRTNRALVYVNAEFLQGGAGPKTKANLYRLIECLARHSEDVTVVEGSWLHAVDQLKAIRQALLTNQNPPGPFVTTLDCTTFNREALLTTLLLLRSLYPALQCRVLYTSPENHGKWLSSGFRSIRNVMGLAGTQRSSRPTVLVILSGFEPHRTEKVIEEHEPAVVLLGVGDPPTAPEFLERNRSEQKLVLARQDVQEFRFSALDMAQCVTHVSDVLRPYIETHNVVIAPMSTKFSTVATLLVTERYPDVQVTYCLPGEYNVHDYSAGVKALFIQELPPKEAQGPGTMGG
jgi:hypothetical protein